MIINLKKNLVKSTDEFGALTISVYCELYPSIFRVTNEES